MFYHPLSLAVLMIEKTLDTWRRVFLSGHSPVHYVMPEASSKLQAYAMLGCPYRAVLGPCLRPWSVLAVTFFDVPDCNLRFTQAVRVF